MNEMRVGQKGRLCHRWWARGKRPPGVQDQRHQWAYDFGATRTVCTSIYDLDQ